MWGVKIKGALFFNIYGMWSVLSKHHFVCCLFFLFTVMKLLQRWKHEDVYTHPPMAVSLPKVNVTGSAKTSLMDQNIMSYLSSDTFSKS